MGVGFELAEGADLAVRTLQKIEAGRINILITTARRLRRVSGRSRGSRTEMGHTQE